MVIETKATSNKTNPALGATERPMDAGEGVRDRISPCIAARYLFTEEAWIVTVIETSNVADAEPT